MSIRLKVVMTVVFILWLGTPFTVSAQRLKLPGVTPKHQVICVDCDPGDPGGGGSSSSPWRIVYHKVDTLNHKSEMQLSNGALFVIDFPKNKILISGNGNSAVLSLDEVLLQKANGNSTLANTLKNRIRSKLYKEGLMIDLSAINSDPSVLSRNRNPGSQGLMLDPTTSNGYKCYMSYYCYQRSFVVYDSGGGGWGFNSSFWGLPTYPPGSDYYYWEIWRDAHCDATQGDFWSAASGVVTMALGCAFFETGVGAAVCAVGGVDVIIAMNSMADNAAICLSNYPGVGNWGH